MSTLNQGDMARWLLCNPAGRSSSPSGTAHPCALPPPGAGAAAPAAVHQPQCYNDTEEGKEEDDQLLLAGFDDFESLAALERKARGASHPAAPARQSPEHQQPPRWRDDYEERGPPSLAASAALSQSTLNYLQRPQPTSADGSLSVPNHFGVSPAGQLATKTNAVPAQVQNDYYLAPEGGPVEDRPFLSNVPIPYEQTRFSQAVQHYAALAQQDHTVVGAGNDWEKRDQLSHASSSLSFGDHIRRRKKNRGHQQQQSSLRQQAANHIH